MVVVRHDHRHQRREIRLAVIGNRGTLLVPAVVHPMQERIDPRPRDLRVRLQIISRAEMR